MCYVRDIATRQLKRVIAAEMEIKYGLILFLLSNFGREKNG